MQQSNGNLQGALAVWLVSIAVLAAAEAWFTGQVIISVLAGLAELTPVIAVAALLAGALTVGDTTARVQAVLGGSTVRAVLIGSTAGAVTPVCGIGVVPLIAALQRRGVSTPAIMAFWVASPVTDPAMLVMTAAVLGLPFALAKTASAFAVGILAGVATAALGTTRSPVRPDKATTQGAGDCRPENSRPWRRFARESLVNAELALRWLTLALILEVIIQRQVPEAWISLAVGGEQWWAVPLAATVGAPLYLDGYAALPLVRGLTESGMSAGAALAMLIAGAAVSLYSAVAVLSVVPLRLFGLYLAVGVLGAVLCGFVADWLGLAVV